MLDDVMVCDKSKWGECVDQGRFCRNVVDNTWKYM